VRKRMGCSAGRSKLTPPPGWESVRGLERGKFAMMTWRRVCVALLTIATILDAAAAAAQSTRRARPRIEIRPGPLFHRECVDGLQVSHKYPGRTVLMPYMRCWWVRG